MKATRIATSVFILGLMSVVYGQPSITTNFDLGAYPLGPVQIELNANGGVAPYVWSLTAGELPHGLQLDERGMIEGVAFAPTSGALQFTLAITGQDGQRAWKNFRLTIGRLENASVTARQVAATPNVRLATQSVGLGPAAGSQRVTIGAHAPWTASSNDSWLHIAAVSQSGTGNATFQFAFDSNVNSSPRTGSINIGSELLSVTQAAAGARPGNAVRTLTQSVARPGAIAADSQGNVYITDTDHQSIQKWSSQTAKLSELVGSADLFYPNGVVLDVDGNLYIADRLARSVQKWSASNGQVSTAVPPGLSFPTGIGADGFGGLYIADSGNEAVRKFDLSTSQLSTVLAGLKLPAAIAADVQGNVYIAETSNHSIQRWSADTQRLDPLVSSPLCQPGAIAIDPQGNVYFIDLSDSTVKKWDVATGLVTTLPLTGLDHPQGLAVNASGMVYVADTGHGAIKVLDSGYTTPIDIDGDGVITVLDVQSVVNRAIGNPNVTVTEVSQAISLAIARP